MDGLAGSLTENRKGNFQSPEGLYLSAEMITSLKNFSATKKYHRLLPTSVTPKFSIS